MKRISPRLVLASVALAIPIWSGCDAGSAAPRVPPFEPAPAAAEAGPTRASSRAAPAGVKLRPVATPRE